MEWSKLVSQMVDLNHRIAALRGCGSYTTHKKGTKGNRCEMGLRQPAGGLTD